MESSEERPTPAEAVEDAEDVDDDEGRKPPPDDLDQDPAYNPDDEAGRYKGG